MSNTMQMIFALATAVIGLAVVAVIFSKQANTTGVLSAATGGFANVIACAVTPITGGSCNNSLTGGNAGSNGAQLANSLGMYLH